MNKLKFLIIYPSIPSALQELGVFTYKYIVAFHTIDVYLNLLS
jgi:hypothetical protein